MEKETLNPHIRDENENQFKDDPDYQCGIGRCRIPYLQRFANASGFTAAFVLPVFASQTLTTYINSQIPTLEKQFGLSSYESGIIMTFNDFGFLFVGLLVASIPKLVHIPRWLFSAILIFAVSGFLCSLPHFIIQSQNSDSRVLKDTDSGNGSSKTHFPLCSKNSTYNVTNGGKTEQSNMLNVIISPSLKSLSIGLIGIGMALQGAAKSVRTPFLTQYLDNEDKQKTGYYLGIITSAAIFGPAVAYAIGGLFSQIYVTLEDVDMSKKDPRWIGAWWLGFFVFGIFALCVAFPVVCFPRKLSTKTSKKDTDDIPLETKTDFVVERTDGSPSKLKIFKERALSYVRVLRSPVYVCMVLGGVLHLSSVLGPVAFKSKYIEAQFGIPLWKANLLISGLMVLTVSCGAFFGGLFTKKVKLSPRMLLIVVLILHTGQIIFHGGLIFIGCRQPEIHGPERLQSMENGNISDICNCNPKEYFPVCGSNEINYHSPCYAGCQDVIRNGRIYQNCTMIPNGEASAGLCSFDCNTLIPYLILSILGFASGSLKIMPLFLATVRSVEDRDKSTAAGLKSVALSVLALIPAPIVFGSVIDKTCLIWNRNSKGKGACSLYNIEDLRYGMFSTVLIYKSAALLVFSCALWKVWKINDWTDLSKKKENQEKSPVFEKDPDDQPKNGNVTKTSVNGHHTFDHQHTNEQSESKTVPV